MSASAANEAVTRRLLCHGSLCELSGEHSYFEVLLGTDAGTAAVLNAAEWLLREGDAETVWFALSGLRELCHRADESLRHRFRERLLTSPAYRIILGLVSAPELNKRENAVYMLGQFDGPSALLTLRVTFEQRRDTDPLLMPRLLLEIGWLEGADAPEWRHMRHDQLLASPCYLSRWSLLQNVSRFELLRADHQERLAGDAHPYVAAEARHRQGYLRLQEALRDQPKPVRRRELKAYAGGEPELRFRSVEIRFRNHMADAGTTEYTVEALLAFVEHIGRTNTTSGRGRTGRPYHASMNR